LIARETAAHASESSGHHGVMTGVASNLTATASYVRNFIPSIVADIMTLKNQAATATARSQAAVYLVMKFAVVFVIAYVVWQEFS
jgi:cytochrome bd-type quinol oxidase subunit 2